MEKDVLATQIFELAQRNLVTQSSDLSLGTIAQMVEERAVEINPAFQRRERWDVEKQSALIESFILNIPVPPVYLAEENFGSYTAIDGQQRLRAINDFMYGRLKLVGLEEFKEINGFYFSDLPNEIGNTLRIRPFVRVIMLLKQSNPNLKYEVFVRLNRGGQPLNAQEIRNSAFRGPLNDAVFKMAENRFLMKQLKSSDKKSGAYREMVDAEFVLRFLTLRHANGSYSGSLLKSMDEFMDEYRYADVQFIQEQERIFQTAIERCETIWGEFAFMRPEGHGWRQQALAGMFDAEMLAVCDISQQEFSQVVSRKLDVIERTRGLFNDRKFDESVRQATNTPSRIRYRVKMVSDVIRTYR
jgi:hypothetical protein